jgi:hypothetical protein
VEGEDLIAVSRATFDDPTGVPRGANFTNLLLFDRVRGFRDRKMSDAKLAAGPATAPSPPPVFESDDIRVTGKNFQSATLAVDGKVFANYEYKFTDITPQLAGWQFTRFAGHQNKAKLAAAQKADVYVKAKRQTVIYGATGMEVGDDVDLSGWIKVPDESISYLTSGNQSYSMTIFQRTLSTGELLHLPDGSWSGFWLLIPPAGGGLK